MTFSHPLFTGALAAALTIGVADLPLDVLPPGPPPPVDVPAVPPVPAIPLPALPEAATNPFGVLEDPEPPSQESPSSMIGKADFPAQLLDFSDWKLTLPTGDEGSPEEILADKLSAFSNEFFQVSSKRDGVVFSAAVGGSTTKNSKYPRSELREMRDGEKAAWSNPGGTHTLTTRQAILKTPPVKPEVVAAQIHDGDDDVLQVRLEGKTLSVQSDDGKEETVIDPAYELGTPYDLKIVAEDGRIDVHYNGEKKAELRKSGTDWYFKVGAYVQSSTEKGDEAGAEGAVAVYSLDVSHTG